MLHLQEQVGHIRTASGASLAESPTEAPANFTKWPNCSLLKGTASAFGLRAFLDLEM